MKRVKDTCGCVHFVGVSRFVTLCAAGCKDFLGEPMEIPQTSDPVTCPYCAELYCRIKNSPWNEVDGAAMDYGMYEAVKEMYETVKEKERDPSSVPE